MAKPTIPVDQPKDEDIIGEGAEKIRETRQALYDLFPINPDDLDYEDTANYWPAGSLTGGQAPGIDNNNPPTDDTFQDRAFLIGQTTLRYDYDIPADHNAITPGPIDASSVTVDVPAGSTWTVVGEEDLNVQYLRDLEDVDVDSSADGDALLYDISTNSWYASPAPPGPPGPPGGGINLLGEVATNTDLPGWPNSYTGSIGDAYYTEDTKHMWVWSESVEWIDAGRAEGPQGEPGPKGDAATVDVGGTTTGAPGTSAAVINSGSTSAAVFDFTVPRGDVGPKGDPGDPFNPDGDYTVTGDWNFTSSGNSFTGDGSGLTNLPEGKTYRLETDANLRSVPQIQLVDEDDNFSDVQMIAGTGMSIASSASAITFNCDVAGGVQLNNNQSWTYGQYNEQKADAVKAGSGISTRYSWDAQAKPVMSLSDNSTATYIASPYAPTVNGMFISITWVSYGGGQVWSFSDDFDSKLGPPEDTGENVTRVFVSRFGKWTDVA